MDSHLLNSPSEKFADAALAPMHTAEHVINRTVDRKYGCGRSVSAHIEKKKSKLDFALPRALTEDEVEELQAEVNAILQQDLPVRERIVTRTEAAQYDVNLDRLPNDASEMVRIISVGDYDDCLCIGTHVANTKACGRLRILSHSYNEGIWRMRWRLEHD